MWGRGCRRAAVFPWCGVFTAEYAELGVSAGWCSALDEQDTACWHRAWTPYCPRTSSSGEEYSRELLHVHPPPGHPPLSLTVSLPRCCRAGNVLYLDGEGGRLVNNMCFPSEVSSSYAPAGQVTRRTHVALPLPPLHLLLQYSTRSPSLSGRLRPPENIASGRQRSGCSACWCRAPHAACVS